MTKLSDYGNPISTGDLGPRQTTSMGFSSTAIAPIQVRHFVRNGMSPHVGLINRIREAANHAALFRSKQLFCALGFNGGIAPTSGTTVVHRFAFRTGPYTHALLARGIVYPPIASASQAKYTLNIYSDAASSTLVTSAEWCYGTKPPGLTFGWRMARTIDQWLPTVEPDTDYYGSIVASDSVRVGGFSLFDMQSLTEEYTGYLSTNITMHSPVLAVDRQQTHDVLKKVWTRGGSSVLNWSCVGGAGGLQNGDGSGVSGGEDFISTTSATYTNLLDRTSTTVSASTPGYTIDLRYKDRVGQGGVVPCVMKAWGFTSGLTRDGEVALVNSAGTTVATVSFTSPSSVWNSTTFNMPATLDKYDLQFKLTSGDRFFVGAVSIWEQE